MRLPLAARIRRLRDLMTFAVVGGVAFIVQMLLFDTLGRSGVGPLTANAFSVVLATAVAFVGNRYWVFRDRRGAFVREAVTFAAINAATFALAEAVLALAYPLGKAHDRLATDGLAVIGIIAASAIRFLVYRRVVFRGVPVPVPPTPAHATTVRVPAAVSPADTVSGELSGSASR